MTEDLLHLSPSIVVPSFDAVQPIRLQHSSSYQPVAAITCNVYFGIYYASSCQMLCGCDACLSVSQYVEQLPFVDDGYKIARIFPIGTEVRYEGCEHEAVDACDWCARQ
jgi:hypothetical protein